MATLEKEMKEINRRLEEVLDEHQERMVVAQQQQQNGGKMAPKQNGVKVTQQNNKQLNNKGTTNVTDSKTCVLL